MNAAGVRVEGQWREGWSYSTGKQRGLGKALSSAIAVFIGLGISFGVTYIPCELMSQPTPKAAAPRYPTAIFLMGPTASGKTDLAVYLAERLPVEVISVDSALVYRGMDIGTAKPDRATLAKCPHRLIDLIDPTDAYSAGRFRDEALAQMAEIVARGRIPLLVGGTMLYFKSLKEGIGALPARDPALRQRLEARAAVEGWPALHAELARLDPERAARLPPNDRQRVQRALEICLSSGQRMSELIAQDADAPPDTDVLPYRLHEIILLPGDRAVLHARINRRFMSMLEGGLVEELGQLRQHYDLKPEMPSMRAVGYRQAWQFLEGEISWKALYETGTAATRQLAKRQMTWLRGWRGGETFDCLRPDLTEAVTAWLVTTLASESE